MRCWAYLKVKRKISLAVIVAIAAQSAGALLWAGAAAARIDALEHQVEEARPVAERLARVEAQLEAVRLQLDRIETKVDRL